MSRARAAGITISAAPHIAPLAIANGGTAATEEKENALLDHHHLLMHRVPSAPNLTVLKSYDTNITTSATTTTTTTAANACAPAGTQEYVPMALRPRTSDTAGDILARLQAYRTNQ